MAADAEIVEIENCLQQWKGMGCFLEREASFKDNDWPHEHEDGPVRAEKMADAGFYMLPGTEDEVMCYYCLGKLDGWEPEDEPWQEHKRRPCPLIKKGKLARALTIKDAIELEAQRTKVILVGQFKGELNDYFLFTNFFLFYRTKNLRK